MAKKSHDKSLYMKTTEVARILGISKNCVYDMIRDGKIAAYMLNDCKTRASIHIKRSEFEEYLANVTKVPTRAELAKR
jgi:excisionase family DNA binding protein